MTPKNPQRTIFDRSISTYTNEDRAEGRMSAFPYYSTLHCGPALGGHAVHSLPAIRLEFGLLVRVT